MTAAFIGSLWRWQWAIASTCTPHRRFPLIAEVDLEKAAVDPAVAQEWVAFLERIAERLKRIISEAESRGAGENELCNVQNTYRHVGDALSNAKEHVASLAANPGRPRMAFIRAMLQWQQVVTITANSMSQPSAIVPLVDLVEAAVNTAVAREWVADLKKIARAHENIIAEAESKGLGEHSDIGHMRTKLAALRKAKEYVEEHLDSLRYE